LKILIIVALLACIVCGYFFYQGMQSGKQAPPAISGATLAVCGAKPNCVSSLQDPADDHFIDAIELGNRGAAPEVIAAIEALGGEIIGNEGSFIQATFTSGLFRFVDDLSVQIDGSTLQVRSSSRVGHSDLGANRKRVEQLRKELF